LHRGGNGFSLIEVLVSLVVLSVGLLSLAGLQTRGLRGGAGSYQRSQAVLSSYDIIERMRANRLAAGGGQYNIAIGAVPPNTGSIAWQDIAQWKGRQVANTALMISPPEGLAALHMGDGSVAVTANGTSLSVTVIVQWDDDRSGTLDVGEQVRTDSQL